LFLWALIIAVSTPTPQAASRLPAAHPAVAITLTIVALLKSKSKLYYDRRSVGQSVLLSGTHLGPVTKLSIFIQLKVCSCGALSLTRGRCCSLQLLLSLVSEVFVVSEFLGTHYHISLSQISDSSNLEGQASAFISFWNRVAQLYPPDTVLRSISFSQYDCYRVVSI
jgi:hypothetical protein